MELDELRAQSNGRPMLLLCNKADEGRRRAALPDRTEHIARLCTALGVRHATSGARCFVHAASKTSSVGRGGPPYLPEEIRKRIFEAATRDGAADAAHGHVLRLESGSALRVIAGGAIGEESAASLREGMGWLAEASRTRRAQSNDATPSTLRLGNRVWRAAGWLFNRLV